MYKPDLATAVQEKVGCTNKAAVEMIDAVFGAISESVIKGEDVILTGFGSFVVREQAARTARNIVTGETINVPAKKVVKFKAGKVLKDAVNQ